MAKKKILQQNPDIIDSEIDDEVVMMNVDSGNYFGLDPIGSVIWKKLKDPMSFDQLVQQLVDEYDVSEDQCKKDIAPLIKRMQKNKLIVAAK